MAGLTKKGHPQSDEDETQPTIPDKYFLSYLINWVPNQELAIMEPTKSDPITLRRCTLEINSSMGERNFR